MSAAILSRPLVSLALPASGSARYAALAGLAFGGALLLTVSAKVTVPFWPVPMTLQTLAVLLIGAAYGRNLAVATVALYLAQGAAGLPVFAGGGGLAYLVGPTGGYLFAFALAAGIAGWAADRGWDRSPVRLFGAMLIASAAILVVGAAWLAAYVGVERALQLGIGLFIVTDIVKAALASAIVPAVWALFARR